MDLSTVAYGNEWEELEESLPEVSCDKPNKIASLNKTAGFITKKGTEME